MVPRETAVQDACWVAEYERIRIFLLQVMNEAGLHVDHTIRELQERANPVAWPIVEAYLKATSVTGGQTLRELLRAIHPGITNLRQHERVRTQLRCRVSTRVPEGSGEGLICELSLGGCRLESDRVLAPGTEVALQACLPHDACVIAIDHAVVRWAHSRQHGIEFLHLRPEDTARLQRLLERAGSVRMTDTRNRRKATRFPVDIPVDYLGKEFLGHGTVINVSPYGVLIRGNYLPVIGTNVSMRLFPLDDKEPLSVARAVVRWQRGAELGVEIMTLTPEAHARLIGLMTSVLKHRGCVCAPNLPWLCRCLPARPPDYDTDLRESFRHT